MKRFFILLALLLPIAAFGQGTRISVTAIAPNGSGIGAETIYGISQTNAYVDSAWTYLKANGVLGTDAVYKASKITAADSAHFVSGPVTTSDTYGPVSASTLLPYQQAAYGVVKFGTGAVSQTDTGVTLIYTPHGGTFVVTGVFAVGGNDTAGYTSNSVIKVGTNASTYDNLCASVVPPLGAAGTLTGTIVSPRKVVPSGTPIYAHRTTAAVATTETARVYVTGYYQ